MQEELIEYIAKNEHQRWAKWQSHVHECCTENADGTLTIPKRKVDKWKRECKTKYVNLTEEEKDSDRREARYILGNLKKYFKNTPALGLAVAGFGAIGKIYLDQKYTNVIDMESGNFAHVNAGYEDIPAEKRKGTVVRPQNPEWPQNYFDAILEARKFYDVVLTSMHWDLLEFFEKNNIPYYLVFPQQGLEDEYTERCQKRGNNREFTQNMVKNIKIWGEKLKEYKPYKVILLGKGEFLEDALKKEGIL